MVAGLIHDIPTVQELIERIGGSRGHHRATPLRLQRGGTQFSSHEKGGSHPDFHRIVVRAGVLINRNRGR